MIRLEGNALSMQLAQGCSLMHGDTILRAKAVGCILLLL